MKVDCTPSAKDGITPDSTPESGKTRAHSRASRQQELVSLSMFLVHWVVSSKLIDSARAEFDLNLPKGFDIPLAFKFTNSTETPNFRAQIYVNGYQFGKYANNVGPQTEFPVPEGIINHQGKNTLGVSLWAMDKAGAKIEGLELVATALVQSGFGKVEASEQPKWKERKGAY